MLKTTRNKSHGNRISASLIALTMLFLSLSVAPGLGQNGESDLKQVRTISQLALLNLEQGRYAQSEELYNRALSLLKDKLGSNDANVATALNNIALLYRNEQRYDLAENALREGLSIREKSYGPNDRRVAQNLVNLGDVYQAEHKYSDAADVLKRAMDIEQTSKSPVEGSDLPLILNELAGVYRKQKNYTASEAIYRKLLEWDEKEHGSESAFAAGDLNKLSSLLSEAGNEAEADNLRNRAETIKSRLPGGADTMYHAPSTIFGANKTPLPIKNKWAVVIGISNFKDKSINLKYAAKDATDFRNYLVSDGHFPADHVKLLIDQTATRENIIDTLGEKWLGKVADPADLIVLYVSTHGTAARHDASDTNFMVPYEGNIDNIVFSGIPMQWLTVGLKNMLHCRRLIVVMDVCHSGAVADAASNTTNSDHDGIGANLISMNDKSRSAYAPEQEQQINSGQKGIGRTPNFDVRKVLMGTGQIVLTSSAADQISWESRHYPNSVFTRRLIEGLRSKGDRTTLGDAYEYMRTKVEDEVLQDRGALQTPVLLSQSWDQGDVVLSVVPER